MFDLFLLFIPFMGNEYSLVLYGILTIILLRRGFRIFPLIIWFLVLFILSFSSLAFEIGILELLGIGAMVGIASETVLYFLKYRFGRLSYFSIFLILAIGLILAMVFGERNVILELLNL